MEQAGLALLTLMNGGCFWISKYSLKVDLKCGHLHQSFASAKQNVLHNCLLVEIHRLDQLLT
jgi:hypothetical protein